MTDDWCELAVYADRASAEALAGLLRSERIDVRVKIDEPVPGLLRHCSLWVPQSDVARARAVCAEAQLTEEEWLEHEKERRGTDDPSSPQDL